MKTLPPLSTAQRKTVRDLIEDKKVRDAEGAFVLEGPKPILELLRSRPTALRFLVLRAGTLEDSPPATRDAVTRSPVPVFEVTERQFQHLSEVEMAQGMLAVVAKPRWDEDRILGSSPFLGVFGEALQDPTNVGVIIRTTAALGLNGLWLSPGSADPFSPKVVRTSAGGVLALPVFAGRDATEFLNRQCQVLAAQPPGSGSRPIANLTDRPARAVLAFGNESRGLSTATLNRAAIRFHIPLAAGVDSLNLATAVAIAAHHVLGLPIQSA